MAHFTDAEAAAWLKEQPKKPISSKVVLVNDKNELLVVKPNYKPGWFFVGGMLNANESPLQGAIRETEEEVGLTLTTERLDFMGVRYGVSRRSGDDYIHFVFRAAINDEEIAQMHIDRKELDDMRWIVADVTDPEIKDHVYKLVLEGVKMSRLPIYSENDTIEL